MNNESPSGTSNRFMAFPRLALSFSLDFAFFSFRFILSQYDGLLMKAFRGIYQILGWLPANIGNEANRLGWSVKQCLNVLRIIHSFR